MLSYALVVWEKTREIITIPESEVRQGKGKLGNGWYPCKILKTSELLDTYFVTTDGDVLTANDDSLSTSVFLNRQKETRTETRKQNQIKEKQSEDAHQSILNKKPVIESDASDEDNDSLNGSEKEDEEDSEEENIDQVDRQKKDKKHNKQNDGGNTDKIKKSSSEKEQISDDNTHDYTNRKKSKKSDTTEMERKANAF
ncbi:nucleoplasmin-like protein ANO39 [Copidosoma floridanum]|uniref:nucleoplasmin-like protein ANO39 n=1 Tax=Copidosoma floridanum TaxID=29053 RepID=UPI0006C9AB46|nr:nucleoplasmin-like protein ANO39 [Copidosoma floridanum]